MRFASRAYRLAKDPEHPGQNQDACCLDSARGVAAIADGVASGIFSRQWAAILTEAVVERRPDPDDAESFAAWLAERREEWNRGVDPAQLAWFQKPKLREGAFSTLLWIELLPAPGGDAEREASCRLHARAVGDTCLLHVRAGQILRTFPIEKSEQLQDNPVVIGSVDLGRDNAIEFQTLEEECLSGDLLILATDAVADWALRLVESGEPPDWEALGDLSESEWQEEVKSLRGAGQMRYDDATLLLLRVAEGAAETDQSDEPEDEYALADPGPPSAPPPLDAGSGGEPSGQVELDPEPAAPGPPPVPSAGGLPPPPEADSGEPDWREKFKSASEKVSDQVSGGVLWGLEKLRKAAESAEAKLRERRGKGKADPDQSEGDDRADKP